MTPIMSWRGSVKIGYNPFHCAGGTWPFGKLTVCSCSVALEASFFFARFIPQAIVTSFNRNLPTTVHLMYDEITEINLDTSFGYGIRFKHMKAEVPPFLEFGCLDRKPFEVVAKLREQYLAQKVEKL